MSSPPIAAATSPAEGASCETSARRRGPWLDDELAALARLHMLHGSRWKLIAQDLATRSDNDAKKRFYAVLRGAASAPAPAPSGAGASGGAALLRAYAQAVGPHWGDEGARRRAYAAASGEAVEGVEAGALWPAEVWNSPAPGAAEPHLGAGPDPTSAPGSLTLLGPHGGAVGGALAVPGAAPRAPAPALGPRKRLPPAGRSPDGGGSGKRARAGPGKDGLLLGRRAGEGVWGDSPESAGAAAGSCGSGSSAGAGARAHLPAPPPPPQRRIQGATSKAGAAGGVRSVSVATQATLPAPQAAAAVAAPAAHGGRAAHVADLGEGEALKIAQAAAAAAAAAATCLMVALGYDGGGDAVDADGGAGGSGSDSRSGGDDEGLSGLWDSPEPSAASLPDLHTLSNLWDLFDTGSSACTATAGDPDPYDGLVADAPAGLDGLWPDPLAAPDCGPLSGPLAPWDLHALLWEEPALGPDLPHAADDAAAPAAEPAAAVAAGAGSGPGAAVGRECSAGPAPRPGRGVAESGSPDLPAACADGVSGDDASVNRRSGSSSCDTEGAAAGHQRPAALPQVAPSPFAAFAGSPAFAAAPAAAALAPGPGPAAPGGTGTGTGTVAPWRLDLARSARSLFMRPSDPWPLLASCGSLAPAEAAAAAPAPPPPAPAAGPGPCSEPASPEPEPPAPSLAELVPLPPQLRSPWPLMAPEAAAWGRRTDAGRPPAPGGAAAVTPAGPAPAAPPLPTETATLPPAIKGALVRPAEPPPPAAAGLQVPPSAAAEPAAQGAPAPPAVALGALAALVALPPQLRAPWPLLAPEAAAWAWTAAELGV
ncbi:hypothetical protein HYH03_004298 [Edaphochlamys debaryana]|uniref:Uncharacterized protein n=1 Tax=Edaphochlamys debaryana TaxID=47281 RepID=A0A835Y7N4_9CHLO|nr:hypothetical protein HYH03_004298 [Edaphochlamys debaryana]|eukprot:KAG2497551.1 hypothetical protein HYH03_004298 [Edaphochlamys debaryana]